MTTIDNLMALADATADAAKVLALEPGKLTLAIYDKRRAALRAALTEALAQPQFTGLPKRKLDMLLADGYQINGVSFKREQVGSTWKHGFITTGGMVGWWHGENEQAAQPARKPKKNDMEWMLTNAFYRMYNHGKNGNPVSAQCEVQALGMYLRGEDMPAWRTSVVDKPSQPAREPLSEKRIQKIYIQTYNEGNHGRNLENAFARAIELAHGIGA